MKNVQKEQQVSKAPPVKKKRKYTTIFSPEDRAEIGMLKLTANTVLERAPLACSK